MVAITGEKQSSLRRQPLGSVSKTPSLSHRVFLAVDEGQEILGLSLTKILCSAFADVVPPANGESRRGSRTYSSLVNEIRRGTVCE